MKDPADDRDEPTDEEIAQVIDAGMDYEILDLMSLTTDAEILAWALALQTKIHDAIEINRENDASDGDE